MKAVLTSYPFPTKILKFYTGVRLPNELQAGVLMSGRSLLNGDREKQGSEALKNKIKAVYKWDSEIPELNQISKIKFDDKSIKEVK